MTAAEPHHPRTPKATSDLETPMPQQTLWLPVTVTETPVWQLTTQQRHQFGITTSQTDMYGHTYDLWHGPDGTRLDPNSTVLVPAGGDQ